MEHIEIIRMLQKINWADLDENESNKLELEFNLAIKKIEEELESVQDVVILQEIIEKDESEYFIPIGTMFRIYQKLIRLVENKRFVLENFASYLMIYGVDWEDEAKQINTALDDADMEKATLIAMSVDYNKYQREQ
ncbi:hypothetical protein ERICIV_00546 [Paenibacillus larvae subsp. larvae]|uniref:Uncharacterized protein n=1 Tax=Paenibacillus larvae subsp. larvae TaxID=147375 RepID=A0A2L1TVS1_9BACL|nr:hypothetical protein [Paenibacillus larvae]AQT85427.1 hypothetical protein B1222_15085 [Paenibacillus larvae subsp. pulvifaciens]AQZ47433.1 hypothetical protein B5S25_13440 [Paenibacillus larvae subsp. pulvifaciens]AVF24773.1 hypothetical protein ERICIII_00547 [Paenibacillus larvae subsp. larvae]AVF29533.1 hypothetical protein ERICIV_00546 [Paenibacillus larvae subsp. larvae]MBH0341025.1 hypothetical protein [Paenibacillus larvae]